VCSIQYVWLETSTLATYNSPSENFNCTYIRLITLDDHWRLTRSGQAVHDIKYTPGFDYALAAQPQVGWVVDDSAAHFHLHNPHFPGDRQQPNIPGPAVYMSDVLAAPTKPFQLPSIKLMSYVSCGLPGGRIAVHIKSPQDHSIISTFCFRIMFLDKLADTSLKYVARIGHDYRYALSAVVPESDTQLPYGVCSLKVAVADLAGRALEVLDVGKFTLKRPRALKATKTMKTTKKTSRKRQASETVNIAAVPPTKKVIASQDLSDQAVSQLPMDDQTHFWPGQQQFQQFQYTLNDGAHPSFDYSLQTLPSTLLYAQPPLGYGFVQSHSSPQHFQLSPEPNLDQSISPKTLHNVTVTPNEFDLDSPMPTSQPPTSRAISPCSEHPQLIRTTQLPSQRPFAEQAESLTEGKLLSINASLRIIGNVNSMLEDWTKEEKLTQRRLVEFERSQAGSAITVTFKQVPLSSRSNTNISVSCIWWKRRGEAYITSVDTIRLLEHLVASCFNVQEKNRIRRNLEGYHPRTVAKGRPESDDFFKVVMGYGEPRPRVIEKDIKVFPWKSLNSMLNKVIGKYVSSDSFCSVTWR